MWKSLALMYLAAAVTVSSLSIEWNRHRCFEMRPINYVVIAAVWPLVGAVAVSQQLIDNPSNSACRDIAH